MAATAFGAILIGTRMMEPMHLSADKVPFVEMLYSLAADFLRLNMLSS